MLAIYKRNGRKMDITPNPDGSWRAVDEDGAVFKIAESSKKRWFRILPDSQQPKAEPVAEVPEAVKSPEVAAFEEDQVVAVAADVVVGASNATEQPTTLDIYLVSEVVTSKAGAKTTVWEQRFRIGNHDMVVIDAKCKDFVRSTVAAYLLVADTKTFKTSSIGSTIRAAFGKDFVEEMIKTVRKIRRDYKGGK